MADADIHKKYAEQIAKDSVRILGVDQNEVRYASIESEFPWVHNGELIWAHDMEFNAVMFWVHANGVERLNGDDRLTRLSALILSNAETVLKIGAEPLAAAIRKLTVEPRGFLATPEFYRKASRALDDWTRGDARLQETFQAQCAGPQLTEAPSGWKIEFRYFNPKGGVEKWEASGDDHTVLSAQESRVVPDGTFRYPYRN